MHHEEPLFFQSCRLTRELKIQIVVLNVCVQSDYFKKIIPQKNNHISLITSSVLRPIECSTCSVSVGCLLVQLRKLSNTAVLLNFFEPLNVFISAKK